jgi:hypothetical protein
MQSENVKASLKTIPESLKMLIINFVQSYGLILTSKVCTLIFEAEATAKIAFATFWVKNTEE